MLTTCPQCGHQPLPPDQALPAACPACGLILAKWVARRDANLAGAALPDRSSSTALGSRHVESSSAWGRSSLRVPERVDRTEFLLHAALLMALAIWGLHLIRLDYTEGEIFRSFVHGPLLVFHEAGHVLFGVFGDWLMVMGGTLGQLLVPVLLGGALLLKNRDPFGAAVAGWLLGVSLLDVAPYIYDALQPQLVLLSGATGEEGGHDWIYLLGSLGWLKRAQSIGAATHHVGTGVVLLSLGWAGSVLWRERGRIEGDAAPED